jgi:hypothetical protein
MIRLPYSVEWAFMGCFSNSAGYRGYAPLRKAEDAVGKATGTSSVIGPTLERYAVQVNLRTQNSE